MPTCKAYTAIPFLNVALFVSYRAITFRPSLTGVRVIVTTDIPCHVWLRLTLEEPFIHKKTSVIRGLSLKEDVRFCFTVYEDNEQFEQGDTLIHTFWKTDWPPCTTKWLYPFASVDSVFVVSTGPVFRYHNTGESPVPPPDAMFHLNSVDPELHVIQSNGTWVTIDLSYDAPEDATGVILYLENTNTGQSNRVALRKPGATYDLYTPMPRSGAAWVLVGLDSGRNIQARTQRAGQVRFYVMGYTGREVVFPDTAIDIKPTVANTYRTVDISTTWPDARLILTDLASESSFDTYHSIRALGSTKEVYNASRRTWPFCAIPVGGSVQTKTWTVSHPNRQWIAYAYIPSTVFVSLNGIDLGALPAGVWTSKSAAGLSPAARWAFVEMNHPVSIINIGIRKENSFFGDVGASDNHTWLISHVDESALFEMFNASGAPLQLLLAAT